MVFWSRKVSGAFETRFAQCRTSRRKRLCPHQRVCLYSGRSRLYRKPVGDSCVLPIQKPTNINKHFHCSPRWMRFVLSVDGSDILVSFFRRTSLAIRKSSVRDFRLRVPFFERHVFKHTSGYFTRSFLGNHETLVWRENNREASGILRVLNLLLHIAFHAADHTGLDWLP